MPEEDIIPVTGEPTIVDADILSLVPEQYRDGVLSGDFIVRPREQWWDENKPVIARANTQRIVTGKYKNSKDPVQASKDSAYKRTKSYREALEHIIKVEGPADKKGTFAWLVEQAFAAAEGSPIHVMCPHPELCPEKNRKHLIVQKKDGNLLFRLIELLSGKAKETQEVNVKNRHLVELLTDRTPIESIEVIELTPEQMTERRKLLDGPHTE
jgi:hypothetical protein